MSLAQVRDRNKDVMLAGKRAIVVGGTSGIGKGIALRLAQAKVSVTIVGRSRERGDAVVEEMRREAGEGGAVFDFVACDGSLVRNAKSFAEDYAKREDNGLDYLVVTQGIATTQGFTPTEEGLDQKLALHYFGRMAFITSLLPLMERREDPRVLTVLSGGVHGPYAGYRDDLFLERSYSLTNAANAAGFYNDLAVDALSREHPAVSFVHAAPGFVNTNWGTEMPWLIRGLVRMIQPLGRSVRDCGEFMCEAVFNGGYKGGWHIMDQNGRPAQPTRLQAEARDFVWEETKKALAARGTGAAPAAEAGSAEAEE